MPKRKCSSVNQSFGKNLLKYRHMCNYTQQQIADMLNLNRTTYTKYETGVSEPSFEILLKIMSIYGVDANAILGDNDVTAHMSDFSSNIKMNTLSAEERELVGIYRMLSMDEKKSVMDKARELKNNKNNNF